MSTNDKKTKLDKGTKNESICTMF